MSSDFISDPFAKSENDFVFGKSSLFDYAYTKDRDDLEDDWNQLGNGNSGIDVPTLPVDLDHYSQTAFQENNRNYHDRRAGLQGSPLPNTTWTIDDLTNYAEQSRTPEPGNEPEEFLSGEPNDDRSNIDDFYRSRRHKKKPRDNLSPGVISDGSESQPPEYSARSRSRSSLGLDYGDQTAAKPQMVRPRNNLGLIGGIDFSSERSQYDGYASARTRAATPRNNLSLSGDMEFVTDQSQYGSTIDLRETRKKSPRPSNNLTVLGKMEFKTDNDEFRYQPTSRSKSADAKPSDNLRVIQSRSSKIDYKTTHNQDFRDYSDEPPGSMRVPPKWYVPPKSRESAQSRESPKSRQRAKSVK